MAPSRPGPHDATDPTAVAGYVPLACGVLSVVLAPDWKLRVGFVSGGLLMSVCSVIAARGLHFRPPCFETSSVCERLYGIHVLVQFSLALGLMVVLYHV